MQTSHTGVGHRPLDATHHRMYCWAAFPTSLWDIGEIIQCSLCALHCLECTYVLPPPLSCTYPHSHHALGTAPKGSLQLMLLFSHKEGSSHGPSLLAAAATERSSAGPPDTSPPLLSKPGSFNPAASLIPKVVKKFSTLSLLRWLRSQLMTSHLRTSTTCHPQHSYTSLTSLSGWKDTH